MLGPVYTVGGSKFQIRTQLQQTWLFWTCELECCPAEATLSKLAASHSCLVCIVLNCCVVFSRYSEALLQVVNHYYFPLVTKYC